MITMRHLRKFVSENMGLFPGRIVPVVPVSGQTIDAVLKQAENIARNNPQRILTPENVTNLFGSAISQKLFELMKQNPEYLQISTLHAASYHK